MSDVHSDWKDYEYSNYTLFGRIECVTQSEITKDGKWRIGLKQRKILKEKEHTVREEE